MGRRDRPRKYITYDNIRIVEIYLEWNLGWVKECLHNQKIVQYFKQ